MLFIESVLNPIGSLPISSLSEGNKAVFRRHEGHISMAYLTFPGIFKFNITMINRAVSISLKCETRFSTIL